MINKFFKSSLTFIIIAHVIFLPIMLQSCHADSSRFHTFLIPSNYEGTLRIIYDEQCGIKPKVEDGREILQFPKNGILILNTNSYADTGNEYFLIDDKGNKTKVTEIVNAKGGSNNGPAVLAGTLTVSGYTYHNSEVQIKGITYKDFKLFKNNPGEIKDIASTQNLDSLTHAVLSACRAR